MASSLDYTAITDISRVHVSWPAKAKREPPFDGSTVFYRALVDRSIVHPDLKSMSPERIIELEAHHASAIYSMDGYCGFTVIFDVVCDQEELEPKHLIEAIKKWRESLCPPGSGITLPSPPPLPPPCLLIRRHGTAGETFLSIEAVLYLRSIGVQLVGVESTAIASTDNQQAVELLMAEGDLSWLVRVDLSSAKSNFPYFLCAFPIERGNTGPSPCRAVLIGLRY